MQGWAIKGEGQVTIRTRAAEPSPSLSLLILFYFCTSWRSQIANNNTWGSRCFQNKALGPQQLTNYQINLQERSVLVFSPLVKASFLKNSICFPFSSFQNNPVGQRRWCHKFWRCHANDILTALKKHWLRNAQHLLCSASKSPYLCHSSFPLLESWFSSKHVNHLVKGTRLKCKPACVTSCYPISWHNSLLARVFQTFACQVPNGDSNTFLCQHDKSFMQALCRCLICLGMKVLQGGGCWNKAHPGPPHVKESAWPWTYT